MGGAGVIKNLILTGWYHPEYAAGAAAVLRALKGDADVEACSMAKLAGRLKDAAGAYENVYVLGVGLTTKLVELVSALKESESAGTRVNYLSHLDLEPAAESLLKDAFGASLGFARLFLRKDCSTLVDVAGEVFESLTDDDVKRYAPFAYKVTVRDKTKRGKGDAWAFQRLIDAAGYHHRECGDGAFYGRAVRLLSEDTSAAAIQKDTYLSRGLKFYDTYGDDEIIGKCETIQRVLEKINRVAPHDAANVLILGESGTGKELVAKQLHRKSNRQNSTIVVDNCACMDGETINSILFGHERGSFTGATERHIGLFEQADGSTLFLDEIGELPLETQAKLLRVLDRGELVRMGGSVKDPVHVDVRLVAATNRDLPKMVREGKFREDLFQRLSTVIIRMPPLRERGDDLRLIAEHRWRKITENPKARFTEAQLTALKGYSYPGNVRELNNILERAHVLEETDFAAVIAEQKQVMRTLLEVLPDVSAPEVVASVPVDEEDPIPDRQEDLLHWHASKIYEKTHHNLTASANLWGTSVNTFKRYLKRQ